MMSTLSALKSPIAKGSKRIGMGRNDPPSPKGLHVEVGGVKSGSRPSDIPCCKCVDVRALPNPCAHIENGALPSNLDAITHWLKSKNELEFKSFVDQVLQELLKQRCVRVQCYGGKHRSAAVAKVALAKYNLMRTDCMSRAKMVKMDAK